MPPGRVTPPVTVTPGAGRPPGSGRRDRPVGAEPTRRPAGRGAGPGRRAARGGRAAHRAAGPDRAGAAGPGSAAPRRTRSPHAPQVGQLLAASRRSPAPSRSRRRCHAGERAGRHARPHRVDLRDGPRVEVGQLGQRIGALLRAVDLHEDRLGPPRGVRGGVVRGVEVVRRGGATVDEVAGLGDVLLRLGEVGQALVVARAGQLDRGPVEQLLDAVERVAGHRRAGREARGHRR